MRLALLLITLFALPVLAQQPPPLSPLYTQADVTMWPVMPTLPNACRQFAANPRFGGRNPALCEFYDQWMQAPRSNQETSPGYQEYPVDPRPFGLTEDMAVIALADGSLMLCAMHTGIGTPREGYIAGLCWKVQKADMLSCDLTDPEVTEIGCVPTELPEVQP